VTSDILKLSVHLLKWIFV